MNDQMYSGNILQARLGPIRSPEEALGDLICLPAPPAGVSMIPKHIRLHHLADVWDFHYPSLNERHLQQSIDLMVRQSYKHRNPTSPATWKMVGGSPRASPVLLPRSIAACVEGLSGVGKTQACLRSLKLLPQVVVHDTFPGLIGEHAQVVWTSAEIPPSGRAVDLARSLMHALREATGSSRFDHWLSKEKPTDGMRALDEWLQVARGAFLGILHLDEIQNLFKLSPLRQRRQQKGAANDAPELSIVEDQLLKWLMHLINLGHFALLISGTPDGVGALSKRLSTLQKTTTGGYHPIEPVSIAPGTNLEGSFLGCLFRYQWVSTPLELTEEIAAKILEMTGGIPRIIIALWVAAHRVALERKVDDLRLSDLTQAATTWLSPLAPAVAALREKNATSMRRYEDLVPRDTTFWAKYWGPTS